MPARDDVQYLERIYLMILLTFAFYVPTRWFFLIPFVSLFSAGLLFREILHHWVYWVAVTALIGFTLAQLWLAEGNSVYLFFYLSLTALMSTLLPRPRTTFALNARFIVGILFALAVSWKIVSPSFTSGTFFAHYFLHDERLAPVAVLLTELSLEDVKANRIEMQKTFAEHVTLITYPGIKRLAHWFTWLTILTEGFVAVAFLLNWAKRDITLLLFLATAYFVVPVPAFGMALACLGYAQTASKVSQILYLCIFIFMPLVALRYFFVSL